MSTTHLRPSPMASYRPLPEVAGLFYDPVLRLGISWLDTPPGRAEALPQGTGSLVEAVAGIVSIAAARARQAGDFLALRDAVERALGPTPHNAEAPLDPRETGLDTLPDILDARPSHEAERLGALMHRQMLG